MSTYDFEPDPAHDEPEPARVANPPLPCPFCGHVGVHVHEASNFRWVVAECGHCGAQCGEVRRNTMKPPNKEDDEVIALAEWNTRGLTAWNPRRPT